MDYELILVVQIHPSQLYAREFDFHARKKKECATYYCLPEEFCVAPVGDFGATGARTGPPGMIGADGGIGVPGATSGAMTSLILG